MLESRKTENEQEQKLYNTLGLTLSSSDKNLTLGDTHHVAHPLLQGHFMAPFPWILNTFWPKMRPWHSEKVSMGFVHYAVQTCIGLGRESKPEVTRHKTVLGEMAQSTTSKAF